MQPGWNKPDVKPGLVVRLTPASPWRIGPDSGARNHVDPVYHSDSLYGAVSAAMDRLGALDDWLEATARSSVAAVAFSSCFPFVDEVNLVIPPRTLWPPSSPALLSSRVRWKSARFVPLSLVPSLVARAPLTDSNWTVDGPSQCLLPAGKTGPFRSSLRFHAAVDRLTGVGERHSVACLEFRPGAGLWTLVSFADEAARERWSDRVKAAFRLLADSGFGGERSQGWGHAAAPEFTEGWLPEMILPAPVGHALACPVDPEPSQPPSSSADSERPGGESQPTGLAGETACPTTLDNAPDSVAQALPPALHAVSEATVQLASPSPTQEAVAGAEPAAPESAESPSQSPAIESAVADAETAAAESSEPNPAPEPPSSPDEVIEAAVHQSANIAPLIVPEPSPVPRPESAPASPHWLLSLFTPAPSDQVDWTRGNYTLVARAGRVASSGELKKTAQMIAEGSVIYAACAPSGDARDVAPDGLAHPVFRAGFAVSVPLPEVG